MLDRYAVIGNPIAHSKSPLIHSAFARQTGQDLEYDRILVDPEGFDGEVRHFFAAGGLGLNVTVPFKEAAWLLADERSPGAAAAGAVNTLILLPDGRLRGDNTDGVGLVRDLTLNHGFDFAGRRVLLLGAGGAVRGVLRPLLETGLKDLLIANRTPARAIALATALGDPDLGTVRGGGLTDLEGQEFDLIINGTSAGLTGEVPRLPPECLAPGAWTYDMLYGEEPTPFCRWGLTHGAGKAIDGLGMLVEQAAESFRLWRGVAPQTVPVIDMLRRGD
jgi:shikimate dehydrogenase